MRVLAGLGNPGQEYHLTRHNIGFILADLIAAVAPKLDDSNLVKATAISILDRSFRETTSWREREGTLFTETKTPFGPIWLLKPQQYMNRSGGPIASFLRFYKIEISDLVVAQDEIDLSVGTLRLKMGGGDGGHNGLRSIRQAMGSGEYPRMRLGVGRPPGPVGKDDQVVNWVLGRFGQDELSSVTDLLVRAVAAFASIGQKGFTASQNLYNR